MRRRIVCLFALVLVLSLAGDTWARLTKDPSIVLYYSFDAFTDVVGDQSGNGHDGLIVGDITPDPGGISNGAAKFAQGSYIDLDGPSFSPQDVPTSGMTLAAWAKCENTGGNHAIFNARASDGTWLIHPELRSNGQFRWLLRAAGQTTIFDIRAGEVTWDEWLHFAGLYDKATGMASLYINGEVVQEQAITNPADIAGDWGNGARVGYNIDNARPFTGLMDIFCIFKRALLPGEIQEVMVGIPPGVAYDPIPEHETIDVPRDVILSWTAGKFVPELNGHTLYLSESFQDVNDGVNGIVLDDSSYTPEQALDFGKTYYWRVDEVNGAPDYTVYEGDIWRFATEPFAYPVANIVATASGSQANMGPERTIDGSGLDALDQHSTMAPDMWLSSAGVQPVWIQYEFDRAYKLHEMWVWNSNQLIESFLGLGAKDVTIETSLDGTDWTQLADVTQFAQATGQADYTYNTVVDFGGVQARFVRITVNAGWGLMPQYGLSEVRFLYIPVQARQAEPASGTTGQDLNVVLKWRAGREAVSHQVHFSPDSAAITEGTAQLATTTTPSFDLSAQGLELGSTYYWRVDEINEAASPSTYIGDIWSFTTPDYAVVENFDQYDDDCNRLFFSWLDGLGHNGSEDCGVPPYDGNLTGSIVGNAAAPFAERGIVVSGQSMPLEYDNSAAPYYSEAESAAYALPQDWTIGGADVLSLYFRGAADPVNDAEPLYIMLEDNTGRSQIEKHPDPDAVLTVDWLEWLIPLSAFDSLDLTNIKKVTIGVGDRDNAQAGGAGKIYLDDIRLGRSSG